MGNVWGTGTNKTVRNNEVFIGRGSTVVFC